MLSMFYLRAVLVFIFLVGNIGVALAAPADHLLISELQTGSSDSASQEFVEIYNPTTNPVDLSGWKIEYKSAAGSSWSQKAVLAGVLEPNGYYLLATANYLVGQADQVMSDGLSAAGAHVRIKDSSGNQIDLIGWGTAGAPEGVAASAPAAGQSLERTPLGEDSNSNASDFVVRLAPQPQSDEVEEAPLPESDPVTGEEGPETAEATVEITELLVDPVSPQTDAANEFIELYNYGPASVNLAGFSLQSGGDFHDHYTLPSTVIPAGGYVVIYSKQSHLSLTNSGGAARLVDPSGEVADETAAYEQAEPGQTWAWFEDGWQWSEQPTPLAANILVVTPPEEKAAAAAKSAKAKKATKAKVAKAKNPSSVQVAGANGTGALPGATSAASNLPASRWLLISAAALTIGYATYEFRHDIYNRFYLVRRYLRARREARQST